MLNKYKLKNDKSNEPYYNKIIVIPYLCYMHTKIPRKRILQFNAVRNVML